MSINKDPEWGPDEWVKAFEDFATELSTITDALDPDTIQKAPSVIAEFAYESEARVRAPKWNPGLLYKKFETSWVLQQIARSIIQEVKRPGWQVVPKFKFKCTECGGQFNTTVKKCPRCGGPVREPEWSQIGIIERLFESPNSFRQSFGDILGSLIYHDLVMDQWFLSLAYAPVYQKDPNTKKFYKTGKYQPKEIFVEDSQFIRFVADKRGRLKSGEWFCPICWPEIDDEVYDRPGTCKKCKRDLIETTYVQITTNASEPDNRFGFDQMVHGSTYKILPNLHGAPRLVSVWEVVYTLGAMDEWFFDTYKTGKLGKIINFPGYDPDQVKAMAIKLREAEAAMDAIDAIAGEARTTKKVRNLLIGSAEAINVHDVISSPKDMMMMEYYTLGIRAICGVFGVQPIMIAMEEGKGSGQTPYLKLEVNNRTIEEIERDKEEGFTNQLFPLFGVTDFAFMFGPLEKKDELRDAQIQKLKAETVAAYVKAGFQVFVDEEGRIRLTGKSTTPSEDGEGGAPSTGESPRGEKESEASGALINETTVERRDQGKGTMVV